MSNTPLVIRLDDDLRQRVELFREESHLPSFSAGVRALLEMGFANAARLDPAWRALTFDEATKIVRHRYENAIRDAIHKEFEGEG